jgi:hypothetical protein
MNQSKALSTVKPAQSRLPVKATVVARTSGREMPQRAASASLTRRMDMAGGIPELTPQAPGIEVYGEGTVHRAVLSKMLQRSVGNARLGRMAVASSPSTTLQRTPDDGNDPSMAGDTPAQPVSNDLSGGQPSSGGGACVVSEKIPDTHGGVTLTSGLVFDQFSVEIEWKPPVNRRIGVTSSCDCSCGEYRQYVKGHSKADGKDISTALCDGATLQENVYQEDATSQGNCYGHRDRKGFPNDIFDSPDRQSGCKYHGKDEPKIEAKPGTDVDLDLTFKGQSYDKCQDLFGPIHEWRTVYKGKV